MRIWSSCVLGAFFRRWPSIVSTEKARSAAGSGSARAVTMIGCDSGSGVVACIMDVSKMADRAIVSYRFLRCLRNATAERQMTATPESSIHQPLRMPAMLTVIHLSMWWNDAARITTKMNRSTMPAAAVLT